MVILLVVWFDLIMAGAIAVIACVYAARSRTTLALAFAAVAVLRTGSLALSEWSSRTLPPVWVSATALYGSLILGVLLVTLLAFLLLWRRQLDA